VRGLTAATGHALIAARTRGGPFADLADLCRRARQILTPDTVAALIASGACDAWGLPRRDLLWQLPATWRAATGLALPPAPVTLPAATPLETLAGEGWATGIPLGGHPVATQRPALAARGILPLAALAEARTGATVAIAGQLAVLQRPPTAKGVAFVTLEDETGLANLVLAPDVDRASRAALHAAPLVLAVGRVQRRAGVVNVQVTGIESWELVGAILHN
jgi:error-prone DNA polymerase